MRSPDFKKELEKKKKKELKNNKTNSFLFIKNNIHNLIEYLRYRDLNVGVIIGTIVFIFIFILTLQVNGYSVISYIKLLHKTIVEEYMVFFVTIILIYSLIMIALFCIPVFGNHRFGSKSKEPKYSFFSWVSQIVCAGIGSSFFYNTISDLFIYLNTPYFVENNVVERSIATGILHRGYAGWFFYFIAGIPLAYYFHDKELPLAPRSYLYPILKEKIYGKLGDIVDVFIMICIFICITTSFSFFVLQLSGVISSSVNITNNAFTQSMLILILSIMISIIYILEIDKKVPSLSKFTFSLIIIFLCIYLFLGPTVKIFSTYATITKIYVFESPHIILNLPKYKNNHLDFVSNQTIFYWAWWCSWSCFMGLFIAKISSGRTVREYIIGSMTIPVMITIANYVIFALVTENIITNGAYTVKDFVQSAEGSILLINDYLIENTILNLIMFFCFIFAILVLSLLTINAAQVATQNMISADMEKVNIRQKVITVIMEGLFTILLITTGNIYGVGYLESGLIVLSIPMAIGLTICIGLFFYQIILDVVYYKLYQEKLGYRYENNDKKETIEYKVKEDIEDIDVVVFKKDDNILNVNVTSDKLEEVVIKESIKESIKDNIKDNIKDKNFDYEDYKKFKL